MESLPRRRAKIAFFEGIWLEILINNRDREALNQVSATYVPMLIWLKNRLCPKDQVASLFDGFDIQIGTLIALLIA